jgi:ABC-type bacteriocin/lantibiotic exporter with double-glycine peptidase domain
MVLDYYGLSVSEAKIARLAGATRKKGATKEKLIKAARQLGFKAFFKENSSLGDIRKLVQGRMPVIVNWFSEDDGHYSVVVAMDKKNIVLMDPELKGRRIMPLQTFYRIWFDFPGDYIKDKKEMILRLMIVVVPKN